MGSTSYNITCGNESRYRGVDEVRTPEALYRALDHEFDFTLDVAADPKRHMTETFFTPAQDGLLRQWAPETCWLNPPYSNVAPWLQKAIVEARRGATIVALLPVSASTGWFHDLVLPHAEVRFIRGRIRFENNDSTAPFDSMLAIYRPDQ